MVTSTTSTETCIQSQLPDLSTVTFHQLRKLDSDALRPSLRRVVDHTNRLRKVPKSTNATGGDRID
ncbi:hypothetical protein [Actinophytocola sp.]|uniref:hypothetical protein n=1 Tax=Actinophytocola sp. TaxID=1872138 RepID=UPI002D80D496|nr:hypothetical protein [Actinophytocola sp.]HET9139006.1 hypothetical protein [Actinophytocola sp.]